MELKDTIEMMNSRNYKERFKAEYWQGRIRYSKLFRMLVKYKAGTLGFIPDCSFELLEEQLYVMRKYLMLLEVRAEVEKINLELETDDE